MQAALIRSMKRSHTLGIALALVLLAAFSAEGASPATVDVTASLREGGVAISDLRALEVGGIVVLRGTTDDASKAAAATEVATNLGYTRIANLIRVVGLPDDAKIERTAERQLATRVLDGCTFHVDSDQGVVTVDGHVQYELQKDVALGILRNIAGVRAVRASLQR